ncbi:MAG: ABC transporter substrate-binding protein [Pseudomonadota bacterium]
MVDSKKDTLKGGLRVTRRTALAGGAAALSMPFISRLGRAADPVKVGVAVPLSGANAQFGINSRNGIELVANEINANGGIESLGGAPIELVVADTTSSASTAATVAQRMVTSDNVIAVLGAFASSLTLGISEVTERRGVPLLTMSFSDEITGRGYKNVFQVVSKASTIGAAQFDYTLDIAELAGEKLERVAIMYEDTAYGTSQAGGLRSAAEKRGIELVMDEAYPLGIADVTQLINKLDSSEAQLVFPVSYLNDSLLIVRTMRQRGLTIPAVGGAAGYVIPDFREGLGDLAEGVMSISPANYDQEPEFTDRFRDEYGYFMVHEALEHAALMGCLKQALERAGEASPDALREELTEGEFDEGWARAMNGMPVKFDETGLNVNAQPVMVQWRDGELATIYPEELAKAEPVWGTEG